MEDEITHVEAGHFIGLNTGEYEVVACEECGELMINTDGDEVDVPGLQNLTALGVRQGANNICVTCILMNEK